MTKTTVAALAVAALLGCGSAHADPGPVVPIPVPPGPALCGTADTPTCAPSAPFTMSPDLGCLLIAWRTKVFCNWWGFQVPQGTPGSFG